MSKKAISLLLSDTHLFERTSKYGTPLQNNFDLNIEIFEKAIEVASEYNVENIIHLGDVFDFKRYQSLDTLLCFNSILDNFSKHNKKLYLIPGNHDKVDEISDQSYLSVFANHPYLILFEKTTIVDVYSTDWSYIFLPYYSEEKYNFELDIVKEKIKGNNKVNVLLTHQSFNGIEDNENHVIDNSINVDGIFDLVFSGHIHKSNTFEQNKPHYIGSSFSHNFGEYQNKGFTILYDDLSIEFIPQNIVKYINLSATVDNLKEVYLEAVSLRKKNVMVRVIFKGNEIEKDALKIFDWNEYGIKLLIDLTDSERANNKDSFQFDDYNKIHLSTVFEEFSLKKKINNKDKALEYLK